jgi:hypothetical protein
MADPNTFITDLARELRAKKVAQIEVAAEEPAAADLADGLANSTNVPELVTFAGYLGGQVKYGDENLWRVLYLDTRLQTWLLVRETDVLYSKSVDDDKSPSNKRDVIWVKADASVCRGSGSQSVEARFLTGDITRAGDFEAPPVGGTTAAATGVFCEARTPFCCYRRSRP